MIYQVPQFIKAETKIMGWVTFTQLWILLSFGGLIIFLFFVLEFWLWLILTMVLAPIGVAIAFGKIHDIPIYTIITAAIRHFWLPKYYLWKKEKTYLPQTIPFNPQSSSESSNDEKQKAKKLDQDTLQQITNILDK